MGVVIPSYYQLKCFQSKSVKALKYFVKNKSIKPLKHPPLPSISSNNPTMAQEKTFFVWKCPENILLFLSRKFIFLNNPMILLRIDECLEDKFKTIESVWISQSNGIIQASQVQWKSCPTHILLALLNNFIYFFAIQRVFIAKISFLLYFLIFSYFCI